MEVKLKPTDQAVCVKCESIFIDDSVFCKKCGSKRIAFIEKEKAADKKYRFNLKQLSAYCLLSLVLLSLVALSNDSYQVELVWTGLFAIMDTVFAYSNGETFSVVFPKKFQLKPLLIILAATIGSGFLIYYAVGELNIALFGQDVSILAGYSESSYPLLIALISYALFPAIFEELAFRGFLFNNLHYLSGKKAAIIGSAFLFTLVHFSILSFFWLFPFGLLLAYFRSRYNTLLYGMIGHFIHNSMVVLLEFFLMG